MKKKHTKSFKKKLTIGILLLLFVFSVIFYRDSWIRIMNGLQLVTPTEIAVSSFLAVSAYIVEGMTIFCLMSTVIPGAFAPEGIRIAFLCEFYRLTTLGNGAGIAEIHYMHKKGIETGNAALLTMLQYMWKKIAILVLGGISFLVLSSGIHSKAILREYSVFTAWGFLGTIAVIAAFACLIFSGRIASAVNWGLDRLSEKFPSGQEHFLQWKKQILLLNQSGRDILRQKRRMLSVFLFQIQKLLLFYSIPMYLLWGKTSLTAVECAALMALVYMLSGVIPAPSGVGSLEFAFLLLFGKFAAYDTAIPVILVYRFATWIVPFLLGGIVAALSLICRKATT